MNDQRVRVRVLCRHCWRCRRHRRHRRHRSDIIIITILLLCKCRVDKLIESQAQTHSNTNTGTHIFSVLAATERNFFYAAKIEFVCVYKCVLLLYYTLIKCLTLYRQDLHAHNERTI